jgi:hypothetical protein
LVAGLCALAPALKELTGLRLGLVINFGEPFGKNGIRRMANEQWELSAKDI